MDKMSSSMAQTVEHLWLELTENHRDMYIGRWLMPHGRRTLIEQWHLQEILQQQWLDPVYPQHHPTTVSGPSVAKATPMTDSWRAEVGSGFVRAWHCSWWESQAHRYGWRTRIAKKDAKVNLLWSDPNLLMSNDVATANHD